MGEARDRGLCRDRWPGRLEAALRRRGGRCRARAVGRRRLPRTRGGRHRTALVRRSARDPRGHRDRRLRSDARAGSGTPTPAGSRRAAGSGCAASSSTTATSPTAPAPSVAIWDAYLGVGRRARTRADRGREPAARHRGRPPRVELVRRDLAPRARSGYPRWRPGWGRHPLMAVLAGLLWTALAVLALRGLLEVAGSDGFGEAIGRPVGRPRRRRARPWSRSPSPRSRWPARCAAWPTCSGPSR